MDFVIRTRISPEEVIDTICMGFGSIGYEVRQRQDNTVILAYKEPMDTVGAVAVASLVGPLGFLVAARDRPNILTIMAEQGKVRIMATGQVAEAHSRDFRTTKRN